MLNMFLKSSQMPSNMHRIKCLPFLLLSLIFLNSCDNANHSRTQTDYSKQYPATEGGTLINAMTGEPSGLIAMTAGESAASAIPAIYLTVC